MIMLTCTAGLAPLSLPCIIMMQLPCAASFKAMLVVRFASPAGNCGLRIQPQGGPQVLSSITAVIEDRTHSQS